MNAEIHATSQTSLLLRTDNAGVTTLLLNRPQQYNALSQAMLSTLQTELEAIATDDSVHVVILAGAGKAFCAGHDLKEMQASPDNASCQALFAQCSQMMLTINRLPQPVIAKVHGIATAAGCQLVAACDLAVAADVARFATSGINLGLFCSTPSVPVSRVMPPKQALELLLTGEFISADKALQYGLVNRVVASEALDEATQALADSIASKSAAAIRLGKHLFYQQLNLELSDAYAQASTAMADNMGYADALEGITAFIEKRAPVWQHR